VAPPPFPGSSFEAAGDVLQQNLDDYAAIAIGSLQSYYLTMPRGQAFLEYGAFVRAYQVLAQSTAGFTDFTSERVRSAVERDSLAFVVLRCILGFSPSELAYLAAGESGLGITQGFARTVDKQAREGKAILGTRNKGARERIEAMIQAVCMAITAGAPKTDADRMHRLEKVDTKEGAASLQSVAKAGVPYPTLLYERFLGRPFASHRDAVSESVGDIIEEAVVMQLAASGVPSHKTGRAERVEGFDQAPDFLIPNQHEPIAVIEAKLTEDDGTARDKVTRVQHLRAIADRRGGFEVIACIDGRGFSVRREDMKKLLLATHGKVFTMSTMEHLVPTTSLRDLRTK